MNQSHQSGFAAIEAVLVLVIVAIVGGTGYFVWHAKQSTDTSLTNTANSQPAVQAKKKPAKTTTPVATKKFLTIKEWGVKFAYEGADTLSYTYRQSDAATIISANLAKNYPGCDTYGAGNIIRGKANDLYGDSTFASAYSADPTLGAKFGDYYYLFQHDQAACATNPTEASAAAENTANAFTKALISKVEAL